MPLILAILVVAGILYYVIFRSMPPIILGIVICCGGGLLFYMIRLVRHKHKYRRLGGLGHGMLFQQRLKRSPRSDYGRYLEEEMRRREEVEEELFPRYTPLFEEPKVVDTNTIVCRRRRGEAYTALLLVHEDGMTKVKCGGDCSDCPYGDVE